MSRTILASLLGIFFLVAGRALAQDDVLSKEDIARLKQQTSIAQRLVLSAETVYRIEKDAADHFRIQPRLDYFRNAEVVTATGGKRGTLQSLSGNVDYNVEGGDDGGRGTATWLYLLQQKLYLGRSNAFFRIGGEGSQSNVEFGEEEEEGGLFRTEEEPKNNRVNTAVSAGLGSGRRIDISKYRRATRVERELLDAGVIAAKFDRDLYNRVADVLKTKKSTRIRLKEMEQALRAAGVFQEVNYTGDVVFLLQEILENSADVIQTGIELAWAYRQELSTQQKGEERLGFATFDLKISRPAKGGQAEVLLQAFRVVVGENKLTKVSLEPSFSRITPKERIRLAYNFDLTRASERTNIQNRVEGIYTFDVLGVGRLDARYSLDIDRASGGGVDLVQEISLVGRRDIL